MAESIIRKACDRCHSQKLSCKRVGDEPCERCIRLHTECRSSPSLRYKKQLQNATPPDPATRAQQSQAQAVAPTRRRSPKRRRTAGEQGSLLLPEELVGPDTCGDPSPLDTGGLDFSHFEQLGFLTSSGPSSLNLTHPVPVPLDSFQQVGEFPVLWEQAHQPANLAPSRAQEQQLLAQRNEVFDAAFEQARQLQVPTQSQSQSQPQSQSPSQVSGDKPRRQRHRNRPRQITLRQITPRSAPAERGQPHIHWMAQLHEINSRLIDLSSVLHQLQSHATSNGQAVERNASEGVGVQAFPIDEMFKLTRAVADIIDRLSRGSGERLNSVAAARMDASNPGNSMYVLATYVRLLDMYQKVFELVHLELTDKQGAAAFRFWHLPDVQVGSFAVESSPSLQMSLTVQLAEEFLGRLRATSAALWDIASGHTMEDAGHVINRSMFAEVVDVSLQAVKLREDCLGKHLAQLRGDIEAILDV